MIDVIVQHKDIAVLRYCNRGAREFFAKNNLDWSQFRTEGLPASVILATGDAMAQAAVRQAYIRLAGESA